MQPILLSYTVPLHKNFLIWRWLKQTALLRLPMISETSDTVAFADLSVNSELETIGVLNKEAGKLGVKHSILLMIDLGDLREGLFFQEEEKIMDTVKQILMMENIVLFGIGTNLTCYGAVLPQKENLSILTTLAGKIEKEFSISLAMISGGNSSSLYLIPRGELPACINNLRLGEGFVLGNETAFGERIPGTCQDAVILQAEIIEVQKKPSVPIGEIGRDAFGEKPYYEDRGVRKRAVLALGKQDIDLPTLFAMDPDAIILGGGSDHLIVDIDGCQKNYQVGDRMNFTMGYGCLLKAFTSKYVNK